MKFESKYIWIVTTILVLLTNMLSGLIVGLATIMIFIQDNQIKKLKQNAQKSTKKRA